MVGAPGVTLHSASAPWKCGAKLPPVTATFSPFVSDELGLTTSKGALAVVVPDGSEPADAAFSVMASVGAPTDGGGDGECAGAGDEDDGFGDDMVPADVGAERGAVTGAVRVAGNGVRTAKGVATADTGTRGTRTAVAVGDGRGTVGTGACGAGIGVTTGSSARAGPDGTSPVGRPANVFWTVFASYCAVALAALVV